MNRRSNPITQSEAVKQWAEHVEQRRQEAQAPTYDVVDKVANVPGDIMNWAKLKLSSVGGQGGQSTGDGFAYPDETAQQIYKEYEAKPNDEQLRKEWLEAVNAGRVNLQRGR